MLGPWESPHNTFQQIWQKNCLVVPSSCKPASPSWGLSHWDLAMITPGEFAVGLSLRKRPMADPSPLTSFLDPCLLFSLYFWGCLGRFHFVPEKERGNLNDCYKSETESPQVKVLACSGRFPQVCWWRRDPGGRVGCTSKEPCGSLQKTPTWCIADAVAPHPSH